MLLFLLSGELSLAGGLFYGELFLDSVKDLSDDLLDLFYDLLD